MHSESSLNRFVMVTLVFILLVALPSVLGRGDYGSCQCNREITYATSKLYRDACAEAFHKCSGGDDDKCNCYPNCRVGGRVIAIWRSVRGWTCRARCGGGTFQCAAPPGGIGDPHLTGFDGSQFDFHGVDRGRYLMLRKVGDSALVAQMRARLWTDTKQGIVKTFFYKFGLVAAAGDAKVLISLDERSVKDVKPVVQVNGNQVTGLVSVKDVVVTVNDADGSISVDSKGIEYRFFPKVLHGRNYHFDFSVRIKDDIDAPDLYSGILGDTVLLKKDTVVSSEHADNGDFVNLEMSRRQMYSVDSLFEKFDDDIDEK